MHRPPCLGDYIFSVVAKAQEKYTTARRGHNRKWDMRQGSALFDYSGREFHRKNVERPWLVKAREHFGFRDPVRNSVIYSSTADYNYFYIVNYQSLS